MRSLKNYLSGDQAKTPTVFIMFSLNFFNAVLLLALFVSSNISEGNWEEICFRGIFFLNKIDPSHFLAQKVYIRYSHR